MTTLFNYDPYYDDFDEDKNFMRVLFRPGYSVQARELTQLQTILSNQIEKFGNHIFKSGSPVIGGKITIDRKSNYIILNPQYASLDVDPNSFLDKTVISFGNTKNVRAKVIAIDSTITDSPVLIVKYLSGNRFAEGEDIQIYGENTFATLKSTNAVGGSLVASIQEGVYYFKGQFVKVVPQFLLLETYYRLGSSSTINSSSNWKVGIEFTETVIDEIDDVSLLDPAQGAFNYQAPGADRFKIETTLSKRTLDSSDSSSFFEIVRLENDVITKQVDYAIYSDLMETMARRTYDESGNYTVDPFVISLEEGDTANGKFDIFLDPGKAYVGGYEFQTIGTTRIEANRAREVFSVNDYDLPTNYESTVVLGDVRGTLDISSFPELDVHCVTHGQISLSTAPKYNSTKIGTVRAHMIRYNDSTDSSNGNTHTFTTYVFGATGTPITGTISSSTSGPTTIQLPTTFNSSLPTNAYANMYFRLTDNSEISPSLIVSSNATFITLENILPFNPTSNTFSIESSFNNAESLVANGGLYIAFAGNIDADSKSTTTGFASINEATNAKLIFNTPYNAIKANTISNMDFYARKKYSYTSTGGIVTVTATSPDTFAFSSGSGTISDTLLADNIICFVRSDSATDAAAGLYPNTVVALANNNYTVTSLSTSQFEIDFNTAETIKVDLLITTKINNAEDDSTGITKRKEFIPVNTGIDLHSLIPYEMNTGGTEGTDILYAANTSGETVAFTGGMVFKSIGATNFTESAILTDLRTPGKEVSLQVPDIYEIIAIYDSRNTGSNVTSSMIGSTVYDITNNYEFNNGQKKTHYDHATIKLRRGYSAPTGRVFVQYRYYKNISAYNGLFTVDSYTKGSNIEYTEIPVFDDNGNQTSLRSAFDFRPYREVAGTTLGGVVNPEPLETINMNYDYYLPRIDRLVVKSGGGFSLVNGQSALQPIPPSIKIDDMLIYTLYIPAYTESVKEIRADFKNNRRYRMEDIQSFENRMQSMEYYIALNSLEKDAVNQKILDANGFDRSKYGVFVDNFTQKEATQYTKTNDNRNLIQNGKLYPASLMKSYPLVLDYASPSASIKTLGVGEKRTFMMNYTSESFITQKYATKSTPAAVAWFANFKGTTNLFPEYTADVDTGYTAKVVLNSTQGLDNAFKFVNDAFKYVSDKNPQWLSDKNNPFAQVADTSWYKTRNETSVTVQGSTTTTVVNEVSFLPKGTELNLTGIKTSSSEVDVGTFVTDLAIQPYIKPNRIVFSSVGLRPDTTVYTFFDNVDVNKYIVAPNKVTLNANTTLVNGETILIANTYADLVVNVVSFLAGGDSYDAATAVMSEPGSAKISIINETREPLASKFIYGINDGKSYSISSVDEHHSGVTRGVTATTITLASDAPSYNISGNTVSLVHASNNFIGIGASFSILNYNTTTKVATVSGATSYAGGEYTYSFGDKKTNTLGQVGGAFYVPEATFRNGERNFRVTESFNNSYDADAISFADKTYVSSGITVNKTSLVDTVFNVDVDTKIQGQLTSDVITNVREISRTVITESESSDGGMDPLGQTFFVDSNKYPDGVFLESLDLFFRAKDSGNIPVIVQIRPTVNSRPDAYFVYPESVVVKYPNEIFVSENPSITDSATNTNFKFNYPVFLKPGAYAVVIITDSPEYVLWGSEKGAVTKNNEFVDVQPYMGSLYKSQNTMEYEALVNEDLMLKLNRCKFTVGNGTVLLSSPKLNSVQNVDKFRLLENSIIPNTSVTSINYSLKATPISGSKETVYRAITPYSTYNFGEDSQYSVGFRRKKMLNRDDWTIRATLSTTSDVVSPVVSLESLYLNTWENFIDNGAIDPEDFTIVNPGSGYSNANTIVVTSTAGTGANANVSVDGNGNVVGIYITSSGSNYNDDFSISYYTHPTTPATIVLNSEFDSSGGNALARYITKPIILADGYNAGDLRVFLAANKPGSSEVHVYYKLLNEADDTTFDDRPYEKMICANPTRTPSPDFNTYREYEYRPSLTTNSITYTGTNGVTYDEFKTFAIKIVLTSSDPAIVPSVKDLRIIATPAE